MKLVKEHVKYFVLPSKIKQNNAEKENMNKNKSSYEGKKNGNEGQNDAKVLKTYCSDTMSRNMGLQES